MTSKADELVRLKQIKFRHWLKRRKAYPPHDREYVKQVYLSPSRDYERYELMLSEILDDLR